MKSIQQLQSDFNRATKEVQQAIKKNLPRLIGTEAVKLIKNNFTTASYFGGASWKRRSGATFRAYSYNRSKKFRTKTGKASTAQNKYKGSRYKNSNPLLLQTRRLYKSIKYKIKGNVIFIGVNDTTVNIDITQHLNEGGKGKWGKATTNTPKRQFLPIGSQAMPAPMKKMIEKEFNQEFDRALKLFKK